MSLSSIYSNPFNLFNGFESSSTEYKEALWGLHNGIYRGACLYDAINNRAGKFSSIDAIQEAVSAGDFSDIYIGDYILFNITTSYGGTESVKDCVGGINYYLNHGGMSLQLTTNHLLLIPEHTLSTYLKMNTTDTTETGYINSNMAKTILPEYGTAFNTALGGHTLNFQFYCSSAGTTESTWNKITNNNGGSSKWNQGNGNIILPSEMAVFGGVSASSTIYDTGSFSSQLPYFALRPDKIPARQGYNGTSSVRFWCLGVATRTSFVTCFLNGMPDFERCTREDVCIRPIVLFG